MPRFTMMLVIAILAIGLLSTGSLGDPLDEFMLGARLSSYLTKRVWDGVWTRVSPLEQLRNHGFEWACVQMRTTSSTFLKTIPVSEWNTLPWRNEYWCSYEMAKQMLEEAQDAGFRLWLYLNMTDDDAMGAYQHAPAEWRGLSQQETEARLEEYTHQAVSSLIADGIDIEVYSMSGEIEWGILDFGPAFNSGGRLGEPRPGEDTLDYMDRVVWPVEASLLAAGIRGVRRADPDAVIVLYVAGISFFPSPQYDNLRDMIPRFFRAMKRHRVDYDISGFSWVYPYCEPCWPFPEMSVEWLFGQTASVAAEVAALGKPVIIAEAGYPSSPAGIAAQDPMPGYPYTMAGQADLIEELLEFSYENDDIDGFFYFAPDWIPRPYHTETDFHLDGNSFFNGNETAKPALDVVEEFARLHLNR